jgi:ubiquinone/menaquinone biosynthesis C-methylase UbiE
MSIDQELERLREVYRYYHESGIAEVRWSGANPGNQMIRQERAQVLGELLARWGFAPLDSRRVLDIGCGSGEVLADFMRWGALPQDLYGIDLLFERVETAKHRFPGLHFYQGNAEQLDFPDAFFDLVGQFTVFTSILDDRMARNITREIRRVLKPGGAVIWYDFRFDNPWNAHVRGITRPQIEALFSDFSADLRSITLLPPLARCLGRATQTLYPILSKISALHTHYIGLLMKPK